MLKDKIIPALGLVVVRKKFLSLVTDARVTDGVKGGDVDIAVLRVVLLMCIFLLSDTLGEGEVSCQVSVEYNDRVSVLSVKKDI